MGNITSHAQISAHVIKQLIRVRPREEYSYLELGNFLTDISQFRDPFAYFSAKPRIAQSAWQKVADYPVGERGIARAYLSLWLDEWLGKLLGKARPRNLRYSGALARFFTHIARFSTHYFFANDSPIWNSQLGTMSLRDVFGNHFQPLLPREVDHVFEWAFTQYYPHEHLDFPPARHPSQYQRYHGTNLIRYLEQQIQYISEELTKIEFLWVEQRRLPIEARSRHDMLVRLGHILHAVEDYFFHSNFVEIYRWNSLRHEFPRLRVDNERDYNWLLLNSLPSTSDNAESVQLRRRLARRLRFPSANPNEQSSDATNLVYTGGFGATDMFHTLLGALVGLEELFEREPQHGQHIINSDLVLFRVMFNKLERRQMVDDESYETVLINKHTEQLNSGVYRNAIEQWRRQGKISAIGARELQSAFSVDKTLDAEYNYLPGVGGFLIGFLAEAERETDRSIRKVKELNNSENSILGILTDNGASEEMIGTHSLLAKDTTEKEPLRLETMALAKHTSAALAVLMADRANQDLYPFHGLDWDSIIRHYLRFPQLQRPRSQQDSWETTICSSPKMSIQFPNVGDIVEIQVPDVDNIADRPTYRMLGPDFGESKLQERRNGSTVRLLEELYTRLETRVDS